MSRRKDGQKTSQKLACLGASDLFCYFLFSPFAHPLLAAWLLPSIYTSINLDGVVGHLPPSTRSAMRPLARPPSPAPPSVQTDHVSCPGCGRIITNTMPISMDDILSPFLSPPGPLAAVAFKSGMSAVDKLKLLKTQGQDVAWTCNAVARAFG